jgi:hypothetical protein
MRRTGKEALYSRVRHGERHKQLMSRTRREAAVDYAEDEWDWIPLSPAALAALKAGLESAKTEPLVYRESFAQYAEDE